MARLSSIAVILLPIVGAACGVVQTYSGPARSDHEVSKVFFHANSGLTLSAMTLDGQKKSGLATGFTALPGQHTFGVGYDLNNHAVGGNCEGDFHADPGKEYIIDVVHAGTSVWVSVYTDGRHTEVDSSADCR